MVALDQSAWFGYAWFCVVGYSVWVVVVLQVEFYFSDSNLPGDPFLLRSIQESGDDCILFTEFLLARPCWLQNGLQLRQY